MTEKIIEPLGLERIYFDTKNGIHSLEVLKEKKDGDLVCWDVEGEEPVPMKRSDYNELYFATEKAAAQATIIRIEKYIIECKEIIEKIKELA